MDILAQNIVVAVTAAVVAVMLPAWTLSEFDSFKKMMLSDGLWDLT